MCVVSDKVKFCTCAHAKRPINYWVLHRFTKKKYELIMGDIDFPFDQDPAQFQHNQAVFLQRLQEEDAFDTPMHFKAKDILEIILSGKGISGGFHCYTYRFKKGMWIIDEQLRPFDLENYYDEVQRGTFRHIRARKSKGVEAEPSSLPTKRGGQANDVKTD